MSALRSLLLLLPLCPGPGSGPGSEAKVTRSCTETRQVLGARGYTLSLLPPAVISGEHLRICPQEYTCCSSEIEQRLTWETESIFRSLVEESGSFLVHTLDVRHRKFDEVFREVLSSTEHSLTLLFHRSYGRLYAQHTPIFSGLFSQLRDYYESSSEGLDDALMDFWAQLLERTFPLLHPQYIFSPDYLFCLTRLSSSAGDSLKPFGDSPRRLHLQIIRAMVAARAFILGLETGRDVVSETLKVPMNEACRRAVMRLTGCPLCRGVPSLPPCRGFCLNVAYGCLSPQGLDPDWGTYLDSLLFLAEKVQGPFSFEGAAQSIAVKISEGLMFLQENSVTLSAQVFHQCGTPPHAPARARRAPAPREEVGRLWAAAAALEEQPTTVTGTSLPRLVWELRERLGRVRGFWAGLPLTVCGDPRMAADISQEAAPCWTGAGRGRYMSPVVGGSLSEQLDNPELDVETSSPDVQTRRRRLQLRTATIRMRAAALGHDLELEDSDEDASGSGGGQHYADDWMARAGAVAPPARLPRPPRRDGAGGKVGVLVHHNRGRGSSGGSSLCFHTQPVLILILSVLALLGPR
ncbi:glypican-2 isoform X2 [Manis pentadactyla]|uniref:glypican-2 isoform X2 n=1 Tax=Manis pentadactyla TaxID=143292 RepID=UPI00255C5771|nr:glypican-2 isoform X2 [Manis pentadactyla]